MSSGTGGIMAVPGHDERDWEFARTFGLVIKEVVSGGDVTKAAFTENQAGRVVNSTTPDRSFSIDGLSPADAIPKITSWLEQKGLGKKTVNYKLRDWLFSRQRYWGEPFPVVLDEQDRVRALPATALPDFKPTGKPEPPLSKAREWVRYSDQARRETNTMPQWAGSCWYFLRYI